MKGKVLQFRREVDERQAHHELVQYSLKTLEHERAVAIGALSKTDRLIAEANLRRELLSIAERHGL